MTDPTTEGYAATAAEIDGMVRNLCAYALSEPDPLQRYVDLTHQQVLFEGIVAAIRRERGRALADLVVAGTPIAEVATRTKLATAPRVRTLIRAAGQTERVKVATARRPGARSRAAAPPAPVEPAVPAGGAVPTARTALAPASVPAPPSRADDTVPKVAAPTDKRVLTAAERMALGLPPERPTPAAKSRRRRERASA